MKKKAQQEITAFTLLYFLLQYNMPVRHVIRCGFLVGAYKISKLTNILFLSWTLERQAPRAVCLLPFIPTDRLWGCSKAFLIFNPLRRVTETATPLVFSHQGLEVLSALPQFFAQNLVPTHLWPKLLTTQGTQLESALLCSESRDFILIFKWWWAQGSSCVQGGVCYLMVSYWRRSCFWSSGFEYSWVGFRSRGGGGLANDWSGSWSLPQQALLTHCAGHRWLERRWQS